MSLSIVKLWSSLKAPGGRIEISTGMLAEEVHQVEQSISFKEEAIKHGVTLMSDGRTNVQNKMKTKKSSQAFVR